MTDQAWTIPNALSLLRLALVPVLWLLAVLGQAQAVAVGLIVSALTDIFDGFLARRLNQTSVFGSKLDSIADLLVNCSAVGWLLLLKPEVVRDHPFFFSAMVAIGLGLLWLGWIRYGRLADFHLLSGRAAGVAGYIFLINLFLFDRYHQPLFYVVMGLAWIVALEALILILTHDTLEERVPSPLLAYLTSGGRASQRDSQTLSER